MSVLLDFQPMAVGHQKNQINEFRPERTSGGKAIFPPPTFFEKNYMVRISIKF